MTNVHSPTVMRGARQPSGWDTTIEVGVVCDVIEHVQEANVLSADGYPVDCLAVGHYLGLRPQDAELALDRVISAALPRDDTALEAESGILTQYSDRGIIRGELGQPFFLIDPRSAAAAGRSARSPLLIAIAGMGAPGRFASSELTVVARELCWALGRLGRHHLATVLIGTGNGNLSVPTAIGAWIRGIKRAVTGADPDLRLSRVTFVVRNGRKLEEVQEAIQSERDRLRDLNRATIRFQAMTSDQIDGYRKQSIQKEIARLKGEIVRGGGASGEEARRLPAPTRLTVDSGAGLYRVSAITATAAVPEREFRLDPALVQDANSQLAAAPDVAEQHRFGRLLQGLVIPDEFRSYLGGNAPLSLLLDPAMARLHWEMMVSPDAPGAEDAAPQAKGGSAEQVGESFDEQMFLGTYRGLTRQLREVFTAPPQPPPPARRRLRVMIVANPAREHDLPGAMEEGRQIEELFHQFNELYEKDGNEIEVVSLLGPDEATRPDVLGMLMERSFDVLHFAGHSIYAEKGRRTVSGWVFSKGENLTASELDRLDRVPEFVFSNSCRSGQMPEQGRSSGAAPTLAASFFARGVGNFVCTGWPIDDGAGLEFARVVYSNLLGLEDRLGAWERKERQPMSEAMRQARLALATTPRGLTIWGAYQHYGNPYGRLISARPRDTD
jgi:CHAT domain-containing protein